MKFNRDIGKCHMLPLMTFNYISKLIKKKEFRKYILILRSNLRNNVEVSSNLERSTPNQFSNLE